MTVPVFESGPGGDFETYVGARTGALYRLDVAQISYLRRERSDLLAAAQVREGGAANLLRAPDDIRCRICRATLGATGYVGESEEVVEAYEIR
jgi:hypothetical protein